MRIPAIMNTHSGHRDQFRPGLSAFPIPKARSSERSGAVGSFKLQPAPSAATVP
jgi:hypothetical protein